MSVDMGMVNRINDLKDELDDYRLKLRAVNHEIAQLPEAVALKEAEEALEVATETLRVAMKSNREYARLAVERGELNWRHNDLKEQLSIHIKAYVQDSGREVIPDRNRINQAIRVQYSLSKPSTKNLDQAKLPFAQHFGNRVAIPEAPARKQLELIEEK